MIKRTSLALAILLGGASANTSAQCASDICVACIEVTLPVLEAAVDAAFQLLDSAQDLLDESIEAGIQAEIASIALYEQDVVAALIALSGEVSTETQTASEIESRLFEAVKTKIEHVDKTDLTARHNLYVAQNYGFENTAYASKLFYSSQQARLLDDSGETTEAKADLKYLLQQTSVRTRDYLGSLVSYDHKSTGEDAMAMIGVFESTVDGGLQDAVVPYGEINEALTVRRYLAAPPGVQQGLRGIDTLESDTLGFWRITSRVRAAAEFLAWDLAIRSEVKTDEGGTSLLNVVRQWSDKLYYDSEPIAEGANADRRELLNSIAANESLANLLDILLVEVGSYQVSLEGAKVGFLHENAISPVNGYIDMNEISTTNVRRGTNE